MQNIKQEHTDKFKIFWADRFNLYYQLFITYVRVERQSILYCESSLFAKAKRRSPQQQSQ